MLKRLAAASALVAVAAVPSFAAVPEVVTVTWHGFVVCVTDPCPQPVPVEVCVNAPADEFVCTPR